MSSTGALVVGDGVGALGVARSLGARGIPVWLVADRGSGPAQFSRFSRKRISWLGSSEAARRATLLDIAGRDEVRGWLVFPTDDSGAELVARCREELAERLRPTVADWHVVERALDKRLAAEAARAAGVDVPRTWRFPEADAADVSYPAILKPALKREDNAFTEQKAWRVESRQELLAALERATQLSTWARFSCRS
jgi:D-aspartate ligase